ncbi:WD40/YVTN/BNR-like repeat-containing protein [Kribbella sp. NPDC059898]|uniref:WD40/YVTN/BNR-like repeat-containing protein n=1 Tax=Kribbella sp. NPDC059898 TaxID=3346995 RepID=UPI00364E8305
MGRRRKIAGVTVLAVVLAGVGAAAAGTSDTCGMAQTPSLGQRAQAGWERVERQLSGEEGETETAGMPAICAAHFELAERAGAGATGPADYLTTKFSSGKDIGLDQVQQARTQAAKIPDDPGKKAWSYVGPSNIGGRIVGLVVDPTRPDTVYIAASGGGVWRSTDASKTFTPVWPADQNQTMGALDRGPDGTLWAGTGEANPPGGGLTFFGDGIYSSADGGKTWHNRGLRDSAAIGRIAVDPKNPRRIFAAASGSPYKPVSQRGLYRSEDGGHSWQQVLAPPNDTTGAVDVVIDPTNPQRMLAALWDHHRTAAVRTYGGVGSGLFRSDDGGTTWKRLDNVTKLSDGDASGLTSDASLGRIGIGVAPSHPDRVYVVTGTQYGADKGFYVSDDFGTTFTAGGKAGGRSGYEWWFAKIWVDPANPDHLFSADLNMRASTDGGQTWTSLSGLHADQHALAYDPNVPGRLYVGNDGGVYRSDQNGATKTFVHSEVEPFNQSYHLAVAQDDPNRLATGLQDNGSVRSWTAATPPGDLTQFNAFGGGDGHWVLIDPKDHNTYYECLQQGTCHGHQDVDGKETSWNFGTRHSERITTDAPMAFDPNDPSIVYFGGNVLDRSTDQARTFTAISPAGDADLAGGPPSEASDPVYANSYHTISAIGVAGDSKTLYVGTDNGLLWRTDDLGAHWTKLTGVPERWVNAVVVDPRQQDHVWVALSGFREGSAAASVFETRDGGRSWTDASGNLPNAPVEMLSYDPVRSRLYAATDFGAFTMRSGQKHWTRIARGLPQTSILDIKVSGDGSTVYAATFGRSIWKAPAPK